MSAFSETAATIFAEQQALKASQHVERTNLEAEFRTEAETLRRAELKAAGSRKKVVWFDYQNADWRAAWEARADALTKKQKVERAAVETKWQILAKLGTKPERVPDTWSLYEWIYGGAYRSTGSGAHYAKMAAERAADDARAVGLPVRIAAEGEGESPSLRVEVETDPAGAEFLKHVPTFGLVETVRLCWKRGVNPRVYYPFLPHGFEEKHGLDYFGGQKTA